MAIRDNLGGGSSGAVLDTLEEISANTESGKAAGALAVKELIDSLEQKTKYEYIGVITNGSGGIPLPNNKTQLLFVVSSTVSGVFKFNFESSIINDGRAYVLPFSFKYGATTIDVAPSVNNGLVNIGSFANITSVEVYAR